MEARSSRWICSPYEVESALRLEASLGVSATLAAILARRGLTDPEDAARFMRAGERHDPAGVPGLAAAVELILGHVAKGSRIAVHGDYDVDGICSTAILVRALRALGADPTWEIPSRFDDGYGLSVATVERLAGSGVDLLVTVDCGITSVAEVAAARAAGMDVVVTDHHQPGSELPACPVVHPALGDYPCPELCAAGVALKLSEGLRAAADRDPRDADEDLDLAALATVCDVVPLRDENRRIVREGVAALARTRKPGLRALMEVAAVNPADVAEHALGFRLGPRINAAGRMQRAAAALELLLTEDSGRAAEVARELDLLNRDRQEAETRILFAAEGACAPQASAGALVVAGEGWHPGVVGIVASRLVERWRRPCVVIALDGESGRGSGRSIPAYDLLAGLHACSEHLTRFGGHKMAAGVELRAEAVEPFRRALAQHAGAALSPSDLRRREHVDAVVPGGALTLGLAEELERLAPFGCANPQPSLLVPGARVENVAGMGDQRQHARFTLVTAGGSRSRGVAFGTAPSTLAPAARAPHDIVLRLERNRWNGVEEPRILLRALCESLRGRVHALGEDAPFWERLAAAGAPAPAPAGARDVIDRRGEGFAGVVGELMTSGEPVLVGVADVSRRRESLETLVAGLDDGGLAAVAWDVLAADPGLARGYNHLVALDPPPGGAGDALLGLAGHAHLAWGPADVDFALAVWRNALELRPVLTECFRALRELGPDPAPDALEGALRGGGRHPRPPELCARVVAVLGELGLVEFGLDPPACRVADGVRTELELSPTFRECGERYAAIEARLAAERGAPARTAAA
ncbi:MAG: single-stranded-DNA-specific exonuclease RecJ [Thermoleophilaceae bacterium]|nr:single-stranded-DNA-specific exonuclease RecJ [Thermoleophilaceae bacterium]